MENKNYDIRKHFRDSMDYIKSFSNLKEALEYCRDALESRELDNYGNGHAISVFNEHGSIYEVNYHGSEEINICGCATKEEIEIIKKFRNEV